MYDVFISHASEDKVIFVRPLAERLQQKNISVWYDEFSLKIGDSLRKCIEKGLANSKYGIVVLSNNFFAKKWPNWELDGLIQLENYKGSKIILPIWLNIDYVDVVKYSPLLADKVAIKSSLGIDYAVRKIIEIVKPEGTSIQYAKELLTSLGYEMPSVSDEWWLDVIDYDGSDSNIVDWAFCIGELPEKPQDRGKIIVKKAIQWIWQDTVHIKKLCQITPPDQLLFEISKINGLSDLLLKKLDSTIAYAPQLIINGFGGPFEAEIEARYKESLDIYAKRNLNQGKNPKKQVESCDECFALRDPNFGFYSPARVTCNFVQGELMGYSPKMYEHFDYLIWLISDSSYWLPEKIRRFMIQGFKDWNVWMWHSLDKEYIEEFGEDTKIGTLFSQVYDAVEKDGEFNLSSDSLHDLETRIKCSKWVLGLNNSVDVLMDRFLNENYIECFLDNMRQRRK